MPIADQLRHPGWCNAQQGGGVFLEHGGGGVKVGLKKIGEQLSGDFLGWLGPAPTRPRPKYLGISHHLQFVTGQALPPPARLALEAAAQSHPCHGTPEGIGPQTPHR